MDAKTATADVDSIPDETKAAISATLKQLELRADIKMYNDLVEKCFCDCVKIFVHKYLNKQEDSCVRSCVEKHLKHRMRVDMRFRELNQGNVKSSD